MSSSNAPLSRAERYAAAGTARPPGTDRPAGAGPVRAVRAEPPAQRFVQEEVVAFVERITQVSESWSVGTVYTDERKALKVVGSGLRDVEEGSEYTLFGQYKNHPKFGEQLDVTSAMPYVRPDRTSIVKFIVKSFKGVGPSTAEKFIDRRLAGVEDKGVALEEVRQQLLNAPWSLDFSDVTKRAKFRDEDEASPVLSYVHRDLATRLGGMPGMKDRILKLLASYLLDLNTDKKDTKRSLLDPQILQKCWASLVQDPYEPTVHVPGYGFATADAIGASVNIPRDAPVRLKALVAHALNFGCQRSGHTYLSDLQLKTAITMLDARVPSDDAIGYGLTAGMIIEDTAFGASRYYTPALHDAECELAKGIVNLLKDAKPLSKLSRDAAGEKVREVTARVVPQLKNGLDTSQVDALVNIMTSETRLHSLTAGPGCGKTQIMEVLSQVLGHLDFVFCGPTGKSAKVLSNRLAAYGIEASTIHSTLMGSQRGSFLHNKENPLEGDVMVVDESSMNDLEIAEAFVASVASGMHLIIMGDVKQLPSIAPGAFLRDLLQIPGADHNRLNKTHRNSGGILEVIEQVGNGTIDCVDREAVKFSHGLSEAVIGFPEIARKYVDAVSKYGFEHVALLMSMRAGEPSVPGWNTTYANATLRDLCNPGAEKVPGTRFHIGDRILIKDNMSVPLAPGYADPTKKKADAIKAAAAANKPATPKAGDLSENEEKDLNLVRVVNGDTGTILSYERDANNPKVLTPLNVRMKLDDGRVIDFPGNAFDQVQHSYAQTVHSGQGSEYKKVIVVATPGHPSFINQAMLFTGLSRARDALDINGEDHVLRKIAATPLPRRNSGLVERVELLRPTSAQRVTDARTTVAAAPAAGPVVAPSQGGAREVVQPMLRGRAAYTRATPTSSLRGSTPTAGAAPSRKPESSDEPVENSLRARWNMRNRA